MSSFAFAFLSGKNAARGGLAPGARKMPATPAEDLIVVVDASQVVKVLLPFNTARAPAIRQYAQSYLVDENNRRVLIFRKDMEGGPAWTNIALDATAFEPKLTMCPDIARIIFKSTGGAVLELSDIERMEFLPLVGVAPEPVTEIVTTAEDGPWPRALRDGEHGGAHGLRDGEHGGAHGREAGARDRRAREGGRRDAGPRRVLALVRCQRGFRVVGAQALGGHPGPTPATSTRRARASSSSGAGSSTDPIVVAEE